MASRRRAREFALQALFHADLSGESVSASLNSLWSGLLDDDGIGDARGAESEEVEFAARLVMGVDSEREAIDPLVREEFEVMRKHPAIGAQMPFGNPPLSPHGTALIRQWIPEGASNR